MDRLHLMYGIVGAFGVLLALVSRHFRRLPVSEPVIALMIGIALGPQALGVLEFTRTERDPLLLEGTRVLLAASVMAAALRFPVKELRPLIKQFVLLLAIVMPIAGILSGAAALLLGLPVALAFLVGMCLSPTDPVLAASVVTGEPAERDLPARLRQLLTGESGANDGLALPLVGLALVAVLPAERLPDAAGRLVWEVLAGAAIGVGAGFVTGRGAAAATKNRELEAGPKLVLTLLLAVGVLGIARLGGAGGVLAVFAAGIAYNVASKDSDRGVQDTVDEAVNRYLVLPVFVLLGVVLPWRDWAEFGPAAALFVAAVLLVRRPPVVLAFARVLRLEWREAAFAGWFGPMGVSALFYLAHSIDKGVHDPRLFAAGTLAVTASVVAHGVTSSPLRRVYASSSAESSATS